MDLGLLGKRALVTGAERGVGFACARALAAEGCNLAMVADTVGSLKSAVKALRAEYRVGVTSHATDLGDPGRQEALIDVVGEVDILVNNAGTLPVGEFAEIDEARWRQGWELRVFGAINLCRLVWPQMVERGSGVIVNVVGVAGIQPRHDDVAGSTGEAALIGFTRALGSRSLRDGVRVVAVNPGLIMTEGLEHTLRARAEARFGNAERWDELIPVDPPPGQPEEVADVVAFLASDRASHVSGTAITVDGGAAGL